MWWFQHWYKIHNSQHKDPENPERKSVCGLRTAHEHCCYFQPVNKNGGLHSAILCAPKVVKGCCHQQAKGKWINDYWATLQNSGSVVNNVASHQEGCGFESSWSLSVGGLHIRICVSSLLLLWLPHKVQWHTFSRVRLTSNCPKV